MGRGAAAPVFCVLVAACTSSTGPEICDNASPLSFGSCVRLPATSVFGPDLLAVLESEIQATISAVNELMPISGVEVSVIVDPNRVIPEIGIGGRAENGGLVFLFVDPTRDELEDLFRREIPPMLAHELHHVKRGRTIGYGTALFEAAVSEGLADQFSVELYGIAVPPWSSALTGADLESWTERVVQESSTNYNHPRWFFGTDPSVPRWTGYAVGFGLVGDFLEDNPDRRPSDLFDEPAGSFLPR